MHDFILSGTPALLTEAFMFSSVPQEKRWGNALIRPQTLPSKFFPINNSPLIIPQTIHMIYIIQVGQVQKLLNSI